MFPKTKKTIRIGKRQLFTHSTEKKNWAISSVCEVVELCIRLHTHGRCLNWHSHLQIFYYVAKLKMCRVCGPEIIFLGLCHT